ncbi:MAG: flagellar biosynthesis anti-sigma factor FlgM [Oligoflexia bacterium]|nr:flagellar biosynthesis anti-sigma factor FlgM [Oligoflexia bacterium]
MANEIKTTTQPTFFPKDPRSSNNKPEKTNPASNPSVKPRNSKKRQSEILEKTENDAKVDIPNKVKDFSRIKKAVDSAPEVDNREKVEGLKKQIASGQYKIDYDALTDKMMDADIYGSKSI